MTDLTEEQGVREQLESRFPAVKDKVRIPRQRRIFVDVPSQNIEEAFAYAVKELKFTLLCSITGLDLGAQLGVIYHLAREKGAVLNLSTSVAKEHPVLNTVTEYFPAADAYERELVDLLGFDVRGLTPGNRYPLPDGWPANQYPLRKDWKADMFEAAKKGEPNNG